MKCPKCGYNSFEYLDSCRKCGTDLAAHKKSFRIRPLILPHEAGRAPVATAATAPATGKGDEEFDLFGEK
ncbi:MAG TPA: hypothetical protein VI389_12395 [Geobacteraceae bacterium]